MVCRSNHFRNMACLGEMNLGTLDKRTIIFVLFEQSRIRGTFDRVFWRWVLMQGFRDNATMKTFTKTSTTCFVCSARCVLNALHAGRSFGLAFVALVATTVANAQVASGPVEAWGYNDWGQTTITTDLGSCTKIATGFYHNVAIQTNGTVRAWGYNASEQTTIPADLGPCRQIAAGYSHTVAIQTNGTVRAWGDNASGQTTIPSNLGSCTQIAAGSFHTVAIQANGTVKAWGDNASVQTTIPADFGP